MKCLNPVCESIIAHALNVSINVSRCEPDPNIKWSGYTDFAPASISPTLGTICEDCGQEWWVNNYKERIDEYLKRDGFIGQLGGITDNPQMFINVF